MSDHNVAWVAKGPIPPKAPPPSAAGPVHWAKENLFQGPVNTIITLICTVFIVLAVWAVARWALVDAVFIADSLKECREIDPDGGACWAVIVERFDQFIFGFYPEELRWRPTLAFALLLVALFFALYENAPFRAAGMVYVALYPVIAYFLIWGGAIWGPLLFIAAAPLAVAVFRGVSRLSGIAAFPAAIIVAALWLLYAVGGIDGAITRVIGDMRYDDRLAQLEEMTPEAIAAAVEAAEAEDLAALEPGERAAALERAVESAQRRVALERDSLRDLPGWKEQLDPLAEAEEAAKARVHPDLLGAPTTAAGRIAMEDNPDAGITSEDLAVHSAWLDALGDYKGMISRIDITYGNLGRVGLEPVESDKLGGFLLSVLIGVAGIVLSLPIGILLALGRRSGLFFIQTLCVVFIEFIRGVPLITLLFVANSVLAYFFPPGTGLDLVLRVVIMVTLFASAYMAEVIRGGLAALPPGQYEAADSLGLDYWKSIRLIIMPQALKISIPNIVSTFIGLFKDTTLVVVIGLLDPIGLISNIRGDSAWNGIVWEFYVFVGFFFFVCCFAMSRYSQYLERKLATDRR